MGAGQEGTWRMVTTTRQDIDYSTFPDSDGQPVAENRANLDQTVGLIYAAEHYLAPRVRFAAGGNQLVYYDRHNGWRHVSPDVFIALDVEPGKRQKWETWLEGDKFPDIVFEITSPSTVGEDLGRKVGLYQRLGTREYDPAQELQPPLRAYDRVGERLVSQALLPGSAVWSPLLGAELRVVGQWLRLIDPQTGDPVPTAEEDYETLQATRVRVEQERLRAEEEAARAQAERARAEAAEQALQAALAELARLRGDGPGGEEGGVP